MGESKTTPEMERKIARALFGKPPARIVITVSGGVADLAGAQGLPDGIEIYIVDYDNGEAMEPEECSDLDGRCTISKHDPAEASADFAEACAAEFAKVY